MARETDGADTWLTDLSPTARQSRSAAAVAAVAVIAFGAVVPLAGRPLAALNAFFPSLDAIVFVTDLITSVLLFAQFSISGSRSLLILATGYLFTALIVIPHALTFAGAFSSNGLLGAGIQTGSWLFIFWHVGFALALLAFAALKERTSAQPISEASTTAAIAWSVACVVALVCGLTWLATAGATYLPPIILDATHISPLVIYPISFAMLIATAALAVWATHRRSVLDQWLMVVALVFILELAFSGLLPTVRFSLGFYAGRVFSLVTSSVVLVVVLAETNWLYARLAHSNAMLLRERNNKLMNLEALAAAIAHEVRQPLAAITLDCGAALQFLRQATPNIAAAKSAVESTIDASLRVSQIFGNIRSLFGKAELMKERLDMNRLVLEVLRTLATDLSSRGIQTSVELAHNLPLIMGHKGQLQEVIVNLIQNAIDAMHSVGGQRVLKVRTNRDAGDAIAVVVEDTGRGIGSKDTNAIFDAFFTTKTHGMGLGLAICRMIVDRHGGQLTASSAQPRGAVFRIILPQTNLTE